MHEAPIPIDPERWDAGCRVDEVRNKFVIPTARRFIIEHRIGRVIDVGCGTGYVSRTLAAEDDLSHVEWTLLDRNPDMLRFTARRFPATSRATFTGSDAELYAAGDAMKGHDLCVCAYTVLEIKDLSPFAAALKRYVRWGRILVFVPDTVPDMITYYTRLGAASPVESVAGEAVHSLEKVDGFTGRTQTFLARQGIDYVTPLLDKTTTLREVLSYVTLRGARHFCFVFERLGD